MSRPVKSTKLSLKTPRHRGRSTFALLVNGKTVPNADIARVNAELKAGTLSLDEAEERARRIVTGLRPTRSYLKENESILEAYLEMWGAQKKRPRSDKTKQSLPGRFRAAVLALGKLPLYTATAEQIDVKLMEGRPAPSRYNEYVARLRTLLKFIGRDIKLETWHIRPDLPKHITEATLQAADWRGDAALSLYAQLLFYSGLRAGEAFGLQEGDLVAQNVLRVTRQLTEHLKLEIPKWGSARSVFIADPGEAAFHEWIKLPLYELRNRKWGAELKKVLGVDSYGLRHSYAIWCLGLGFPPADIWRSMGTSQQVFFKHYGGLVHTDSTIDAMVARYRKAPLKSHK